MRSLFARHLFLALVAVGLGCPSQTSAQVDETPLPVKGERVFNKLRFRRPIVVTHAGDGTNRIFIADEYGVIYVMPNDPDTDQRGTFLDIESRVVYQDHQNEEGFLGLAFHPKYRENGQFFVYYNTTDAPHTCVISRFRVSRDDPNQADPASEEEILRIPQPYWNHNGGTIVFGPDGYLYVGLGDGGARDDPHGNGQNLKTWLGSILRIDVDHHDPGKAYAVPKDNPFLNLGGQSAEIYAYGLRNVWRLTFDRETGTGWIADVGQDIWEEIDILQKGGNYGWNVREASHRFGPNGADPSAKFIEPIWEYHHDVGKSITGGYVYRGSAVPSLRGHYVYADYVTGLMWGLLYDLESKQVLANRPIDGHKLPVMTFGEDEAGEIYYTAHVGATLTEHETEELPNASAWVGSIWRLVGEQ